MVVEPPPKIALPIINEAVVVARLCTSVVHKDSMQIVWMPIEIFEKLSLLDFQIFNSFLSLLNLIVILIQETFCHFNRRLHIGNRLIPIQLCFHDVQGLLKTFD